MIYIVYNGALDQMPCGCQVVHVRQPHLMCIASLLNRRYLQVSGSVRVRRGVVGRLGLGLGLVLVLRLGLGLALGLQLGIEMGFRRNHSWSSTFTPRRNHSLCLHSYIHT